MGKLYVTNTTGQNQIVNWRLDFDERGNSANYRLSPYKSLPIPARTQVQFGGDWHITQITEIVDQLISGWGAVSPDQIRTAKARGPIKMIYSLDRPVALPILKDVVAHNISELSEQGMKRRQNLALVANAQMNVAIEHEAPKFEIEFETEEGTEDSDMVSPSLAHGIVVERTNADAKPRSRRKAS